MESQFESQPTGADCVSAGQREVDVFHRARRGRDLHIRGGLVDQLDWVDVQPKKRLACRQLVCRPKHHHDR